MARRATRLSPKALLRLRKKLIDEGLYKEDRPEDTIGNRIRPISDSLVSIKNPDELATRVKTVLTEGPVVPIKCSHMDSSHTTFTGAEIENTPIQRCKVDCMK